MKITYTVITKAKMKYIQNYMWLIVWLIHQHQDQTPGPINFTFFYWWLLFKESPKIPYLLFVFCVVETFIFYLIYSI